MVSVDFDAINVFDTKTVFKIRRQNRLRREYLYKKSLEAQQRQIFERKQQLKNALAG